MPVNILAHDFGADQRGRQRFKLLDLSRMKLRMGGDAPEEAFGPSRRRSCRFEAGEGAFFRHFSVTRPQPEPDIPVAGGRELLPDRAGHHFPRGQIDRRQFFGEGTPEEILENSFGFPTEPDAAGITEREAELICLFGRKHMNRIAGLDLQAYAVGGGSRRGFRRGFNAEKQRLARTGLPLEIDREPLQCNGQVKFFIVVSAPGGVFALRQINGIIHGEGFRLGRRQGAQLVLENLPGGIDQPQADAADRSPGRKPEPQRNAPLPEIRRQRQGLA